MTRFDSLLIWPVLIMVRKIVLKKCCGIELISCLQRILFVGFAFMWDGSFQQHFASSWNLKYIARSDVLSTRKFRSGWYLFYTITDSICHLVCVGRCVINQLFWCFYCRFLLCLKMNFLRLSGIWMWHGKRLVDGWFCLFCSIALTNCSAVCVK